MNSEKNDIVSSQTITIDRFEDERGYFQELFNSKQYTGMTGGVWPQVNLSKSNRNVLRGLHVSPYGKLCTCVRGRLWDVVVDLRKSSPSYGKWYGVELSEENGKQLYVPSHCGHGFLALEDNTSLLYMQGGTWNSTLDQGVKWNDPDLAIEWPVIDGEYILSEKDQSQPSLNEFRR